MTEEWCTEQLERKKGVLGFLYRQKAYIVRGHGYWLNLVLSMTNTIIIIYGIGGTLFPTMYEIFPTVVWFAIVFVPVYITSASFIGRWDLKRGVWGTEQRLQWGNNPEWIETKNMILRTVKSLDRLVDVVERLEQRIDELE